MTISKEAFLPFHLHFWCWHKQQAFEQQETRDTSTHNSS